MVQLPEPDVLLSDLRAVAYEIAQHEGLCRCGTGREGDGEHIVGLKTHVGTNEQGDADAN